MQMNIFTVKQQQNIVSDVIYSTFAYLIKWLWHHSLTKMVASIAAFSRISKYNNFHIYQPIFIFFHQITRRIMLFIFKPAYYFMYFFL